MSEDHDFVAVEVNESHTENAHLEEDPKPQEDSKTDQKTEHAKTEKQETAKQEAATKEISKQDSATKNPAREEAITTTPTQDEQPKDVHKSIISLSGVSAGSRKKTSTKKPHTHFDAYDNDNVKDNFISELSLDDVSFLSEKKSSLADEDFFNIIHQDYGDSDSDGSLLSSSSYVYQKEIRVPPDFFQILGEFPDIDDISSPAISFDMSRISFVTTKSFKESEILDVGRFVDPLTGELIPESQPEFEPELEVEVEEVKEDSSWDFFYDEDDDLLVLLEADRVVEVERKPEEDEVFETFLELQTTFKDEIKPEIDYEALEREATRRQLLKITTDFLSELIGTVVLKSEYVDPSIILRQNLDKVKLMEDIASKLNELNIENKTRAFLNRKTVEYFRRKKAFRSILDDKPETIEMETQRLKEATAKLDILLGKEKEVKSAATAKIANLNIELSSKENEAQQKITDFEEMVKKYLDRDSFARLPQVVLSLLSKIGHMRDEVTEVRLMLIKRQHTFAALVKKLEKLETLSNGLSMVHFENVQTQTLAMGKKIEEKNSELKKLRLRRHFEVHAMAHLKEKQKMLRNSADVQKEALNDLQVYREETREQLFNLKMKRSRLRAEKYEMSLQGGLLDKPELMFDYDHTVDQIAHMQTKIKQEQIKYAELQQKIERLERKCG